MTEVEMWKNFDELFDEFDNQFAGLDQLLQLRGSYQNLVRTVTFTSNTTAIPKFASSYSDGFDDGWNACEASGS